MHAAIHDALNAIDQGYESYTSGCRGFRRIRGRGGGCCGHLGCWWCFFPRSKRLSRPLMSRRWERSLTALEGPGCTARHDVGRDDSGTACERRRVTGVLGAYVPTGQPGDYSFTPPFDVPPLGPFVFGPGGARSRPSRENSGTSPAGAADASKRSIRARSRVLKAIGAVDSTLRTAEQSQIARFWYEDSPIGWNRIAKPS